MHVCVHVYIYVEMCLYVSMSVCVFMCVYIYIYIYMCICVCVYEMTSYLCALTTLAWLTKDIQDTAEQAQSGQPHSDSCED